MLATQKITIFFVLDHFLYGKVEDLMRPEPSSTYEKKKWIRPVRCQRFDVSTYITVLMYSKFSCRRFLQTSKI